MINFSVITEKKYITLNFRSFSSSLNSSLVGKEPVKDKSLLVDSMVSTIFYSITEIESNSYFLKYKFYISSNTFIIFDKF